MLCVLSLSCCAVPAAAGGSISLAGDRESLSLIAEDVSLADVVQNLAYQQGLTVESYSALEQKMNVTIIGKPLVHVLRRVLDTRSFTLVLEPGGGGRLYIWPCNADEDSPLVTPERYGHAESRAPSPATSVWGRSAETAGNSRTGELPEPALRAAALSDLAERRPGEAIAMLGSALADNDEGVRLTALEELADIGNDAAVSYLGDQLLAVDASVRREVVDLLADIDSAAATRLLEQAVTDSDPGIRALASQYLSERTAADP